MQTDDVGNVEEITDYRNAAVAKSNEAIQVCRQLISELFEPRAWHHFKQGVSYISCTGAL